MKVFITSHLRIDRRLYHQQQYNREPMRSSQLHDLKTCSIARSTMLKCAPFLQLLPGTATVASLLKTLSSGSRDMLINSQTWATSSLIPLAFYGHTMVTPTVSFLLVFTTKYTPPCIISQLLNFRMMWFGCLEPYNKL